MNNKDIRRILPYGIPHYDEAIDRAANGMCVECGHYYHPSWFGCEECQCRALLMAYISLDELKNLDEGIEGSEEPAIKIEYTYAQISHDLGLAMETFTKKGLEGWEFVCYMPESRGTFFTTGLFKRQVL